MLIWGEVPPQWSWFSSPWTSPLGSSAAPLSRVVYPQFQCTSLARLLLNLPPNLWLYFCATMSGILKVRPGRLLVYKIWLRFAYCFCILQPCQTHSVAHLGEFLKSFLPTKSCHPRKTVLFFSFPVWWFLISSFCLSALTWIPQWKKDKKKKKDERKNVPEKMAEPLPVHLKVKPLSLRGTLQRERQQLGWDPAQEALKYTDNERDRGKAVS